MPVERREQCRREGLRSERCMRCTRARRWSMHLQAQSPQKGPRQPCVCRWAFWLPRSDVARATSNGQCPFASRMQMGKVPFALRRIRARAQTGSARLCARRRHCFSFTFRRAERAILHREMREHKRALYCESPQHECTNGHSVLPTTFTCANGHSGVEKTNEHKRAVPVCKRALGTNGQ